MSGFLMILSLLLFSLYPLLCAMGLRHNDPILFVFVTHSACAAFSFFCGWHLLRRKYPGRKRGGPDASLKGVFTLNAKTRMYVIITGLAAGINHSCLMYAFLKIPKISAAVIYETWPIAAAWLAPILIVKGWEKVKRMDYVFGVLALIGIAFIICADARDALFSLDYMKLKSIDPDRLLGYGLAVVASVGVCVSTTLRRNVTRALRQKYDDDLLLATYLSSGLTRLAALPVFAVVFAVLYGYSGKGFVLADLPLAVFTGIAVHLMGSVTYVMSTLRNPNPAVPVPDFLAPILSVTFLYIAGYSGITDIVIIGGLFIITANLLVTVRMEDNFAYTASILTLLLGGTYCYFTTGVPLANFYDAISVSSIFYAILIAFAWDRVIDRSKREESLVLDIAYDIEWLRMEHHKSDSKLIQQLLADINTLITTSNRDVIGATYRKLQKTKMLLGERRGVLKIFQDLDSLILSKTKDVMLSEIVLLFLIGGVTFYGILVYRPPGLWPDLMAIIMAGAIVFIFFAIFDQLNERNKNLLDTTAGTRGVINPEIFVSRNEFKLVTIVLIGIMLGVFYALLLFKYKALGN